MGFPDLFFASDIYIGLYDPISVADPGFGVGGRTFLGFYVAPPLGRFFLKPL